MKTKILVYYFFLFISSVFSQSESDDFFPLAVGYSWIYNYSSISIDDDIGFESRDSGTAVYSITSAMISIDSTIWDFLEIRDLIIRSSSYWPPHNTTIDTVKDTTSFSIVEYHSGNHRLVRIRESDLSSVFPLTEEFQNSDLYFRYFPSVTQDTFSTKIQSNTDYFENFSVSFQRDVGITEISFFYDPQPVGFYYSTYHTLQSFVTSVEHSNSDALKALELFQNYPNPFNSSTKIVYSLPENTFVSLILFDCLGNNVRTLINEFQETGNHQVVIESNLLSSGIYFLRIIAGSLDSTIRMVLLK